MFFVWRTQLEQLFFIFILGETVESYWGDSNSKKESKSKKSSKNFCVIKHLGRISLVHKENSCLIVHRSSLLEGLGCPSTNCDLCFCIKVLACSIKMEITIGGGTIDDRGRAYYLGYDRGKLLLNIFKVF